MSQQWYMKTDHGCTGPLSASELKQAALEGNVLPTTSVRLGEDGKWIPALKIKGLFDSTSAQSRTPKPQSFSHEEIGKAIEAGDKAIISSLLESGWDVNTLIEYEKMPLGECSALHVAAYYDQLEIIELLLSHGAVLDTRRDDFQETPLLLALEYAKVNAVEVLLKNGAANDLQRWGAKIIDTAARDFEFEPVEYRLRNMRRVLEHIGDLDEKREWTSEALLSHCCFHRDVEIVKILIDHGANVNATDGHRDGDTPLHFACAEGSADIAEFLLSRGADINALNERGNTPLHHSAWHSKSTGTLKLLLDHDANVSIKNVEGKTALDKARESSYDTKENIRLLTQGAGGLEKTKLKLIAWWNGLRSIMHSGWSLERYARAIAAHATNGDPHQNFGLYSRERRIRQLGEEINDKWGFEGMQEAWALVKENPRFDGMGAFATSALNRIWNGVGQWRS